MKTLFIIFLSLTYCQVMFGQEDSLQSILGNSSTIYELQESCLENKVDFTPPMINVLTGQGWPSSEYLEITDAVSGVYAVAVEYIVPGENITSRMFIVGEGEVSSSYHSFNSLNSKEVPESYNSINKQLFFVKGLDFHSIFIQAIDLCGNRSRQYQIRKQDMHVLDHNYSFEMGLFNRSE
ncbi:MAG: hypothetical protein ACRBBP_10685 [Bdellovibrionales bacterium]